MKPSLAAAAAARKGSPKTTTRFAGAKLRAFGDAHRQKRLRGVRRDARAAARACRAEAVKATWPLLVFASFNLRDATETESEEDEEGEDEDADAANAEAAADDAESVGAVAATAVTAVDDDYDDDDDNEGGTKAAASEEDDKKPEEAAAAIVEVAASDGFDGLEGLDAEAVEEEDVDTFAAGAQLLVGFHAANVLRLLRRLHPPSAAAAETIATTGRGSVKDALRQRSERDLRLRDGGDSSSDEDEDATAVGGGGGGVGGGLAGGAAANRDADGGGADGGWALGARIRGPDDLRARARGLHAALLRSFGLGALAAAFEAGEKVISGGDRSREEGGRSTGDAAGPGYAALRGRYEAWLAAQRALQEAAMDDEY